MIAYQIRQQSGKRGDRRGGCLLTVPWVIAAQVPQDTRFIPELTEDGILYRRVDPTKRPSWAGGPQS